ncbi:Zinc finger CCCH-type with G patch domain-containing protein [Linum grandiflorum]
MGGRGKRRPNNNGNRSDMKNKSGSGSGRRSRSSHKGGNSLFIDGGILSDWQEWNRLVVNSRSASRSRNRNRTREPSTSNKGISIYAGNAIGYSYPIVEQQEGTSFNLSGQEDGASSAFDATNPIAFFSSNKTPIVAYLNETPTSDPQNEDVTYEYASSFTINDGLHRGLDFRDELEVTPCGIESSSNQTEEIEQEGPPFDSSPSENGIDDYPLGDEVGENIVEERSTKSDNKMKNPTFLSTGGVRLYTHDISDEESDEVDCSKSLDDDNSESEQEQEESSESDDSENMSDSDLDLGDEVAEDYLEGIGGSVEDAKWLVKHDLDDSEEDSSSSIGGLDETIEKLSGIALQETSVGYGMTTTQPRKKIPSSARDSWPSCFDDITFVKDLRIVSGKKKHVAQLPQPWPAAQKGKHFRNYPGEKKKFCKEMIANKRRFRMLQRAVDLEEINTKLEQIVSNKVDIFSFPPMHSKDCSQVKRLAAIYHLRSGAQGSGKKRFVTVMRTQYTSIPSANDRVRLEKLIGASCKDEEDFSIVERKSASSDRIIKNNPKGSGLSISEYPNPVKPSRKPTNRPSNTISKKQDGRKVDYASEPVSFVSCGVIQSEVDAENTTVDPKTKGKAVEEKALVIGSDKVGAFEVHTKGFGSKMMAKMGYIEGAGLGKDGQGMAAPIKAIQRPKSLGLGVEFCNTDVEQTTKPEQRQSARKSRARSQEKEKRPQPQELEDFERHTEGFGSKMMAKMGFVEGFGLGKDSQGMVNPLVDVRPPKARGLGAKG